MMPKFPEDIAIETIDRYCANHNCDTCKFSHYNMLDCVFRTRPDRWCDTLERREQFLKVILDEQEEEEEEMRI